MNIPESLRTTAEAFMAGSIPAKYSYNFNWLGRPIIQYPQDIVAVQELVWSVRPDLIIETGIAHGGSLILSASLLAMIDLADAFERRQLLDPRSSRRKVLGIDIDIRQHNRAALDEHPLRPRIHMIEGSSTSPDVVAQVQAYANDFTTIMVLLDSNHTHEHVLTELEAYAPLVSTASYCVVFDTIVEHMPKSTYPDRPWGPGNSPMTAVRSFLAIHPEFTIDSSIPNRLLTSVAPDGYLRKTGASRPARSDAG